MLLVVLLVIGAVVLFRSTAPERSVQRYRAENRKQAQLAQGSVREVRSWVALSDAERVPSVIRAAKVFETTDPDPARLRGLLDDAADFVRLRLGQPDPRAYAEWRLASGYRWSPHERLEQFGVVDAYEANFKERFGDSEAAIRAAFERFWRASREPSRWSKPRRPMRIADDPRAALVAIGTVTGKAPNYRPKWPTDFGADYWDSSAAATSSMMQWLVPPEGVGRMLQIRSQPVVEVAKVALLIEDQSGERRTLTLNYVWDPRTQRWFHESLTEQYASEVTAGLDY
ncbi:MAG TPA: hypothetical protein DEB06_10600 [Phycisphaerales bacterium]|nr:hypothetical protein [Phycisphaerales bacterium]